MDSDHVWCGVRVLNKQVPLIKVWCEGRRRKKRKGKELEIKRKPTILHEVNEFILGTALVAFYISSQHANTTRPLQMNLPASLEH